MVPNTSITLETPRFDNKIPDSFRVYRGQGSNSENSENSEFSDSCTSCEFSESYTNTNSEYGSSGEEDGSDSEVNSDSARGDEDSQGTTTTRTSEKKEEFGEANSNASEDVRHPMMETTGELKPLQLVWAKSRGYPSYPALIIDPSIKKSFVHNSVPLPCPPENVLTLRKNTSEEQFLVLFFDAKRTWQWLPISKLERLGINKEVDEVKLIESKKPTLRKAVKKAYEEALHYQSQVTKKKPEGKL